MTTPLTDRVFLTAAEVAALLNVTPQCVRTWSRTGAADFPAPSITRFRAMRWRRTNIEFWIESMERR